ncbi:Carboxy-terminal domain protein [Spatholobus suberectus]|nr:Carboxy-terminal domain protein [Spatholobus suberectus]
MVVLEWRRKNAREGERRGDAVIPMTQVTQARRGDAEAWGGATKNGRRKEEDGVATSSSTAIVRSFSSDKPHPAAPPTFYSTSSAISFTVLGFSVPKVKDFFIVWDSCHGPSQKLLQVLLRSYSRFREDMILDDIDAAIAAYIFMTDEENHYGGEILIKSNSFTGDRKTLKTLMPKGWMDQEVLNLLACKLTNVEKFLSTEPTTWFLPTTFAQYALDWCDKPENVMDFFKRNFTGKLDYVRKKVVIVGLFALS